MVRKQINISKAPFRGVAAKPLLRRGRGGLGGACLLFLCLLLLLPSCGVKKRVKKADKRFEVGEYYTAGDMYRSVYGKISPKKDRELKARVAFRQGESYRLTNRSRAAFAYNNAIRYGYPDSIVYFNLAQTLRKDGEYADAAANYEIYLQHDPGNAAALAGLESTRRVGEWKADASRYQVAKPKEFNVRRSSTYAPAYVGQSTDMLIFTSSRSTDKKKKTKNNPITGMPNSNLYSVRKNATGQWEEPEPLPAEVNDPTAENGVCSFSPDGKAMYFTRAKKSEFGDAGAQIMVSNRAGGAWSEPTQLKVFEDSTITVAHPTLSPDGQTLYFVSDAPNGRGGKDIWRATLEGGECKYIENMGPDINTEGNEMFPMMRHDGVLYFASDGHPGLGGLDLFKASPLAPQSENDTVRWSVENLGVPFNSQWDDFGITFEGKTENGFFSSNRNERQGHDMLWSFTLPELAYVISGKVMDDQSNILPDAVVRMVGDDGTNARIYAKKDGTYRLKLNKGARYVMLASARGYLNQSHSFTTADLTDSKAFVNDFHLTPLFRPVQIENIFYEFGKWNLTPESETGLQALLKLLNDNPNITIELSAHTDYVGNDAFNKDLSDKRARSVLDYLVAHGIDPARLTSVGYGEEQPVTVDAFQAKTSRKATYSPRTSSSDSRPNSRRRPTKSTAAPSSAC